MEGKMNVVKYLMFFFNALFWLSGLALIIVGAIVKSKYGQYLTFADSKYADAAIFLICVGVIVFIIAFLGCCGAIKEHYCMVTTFAVFMVIIFVLEIVAGVLGLVYKTKVTAVADKALKKGLEKYGKEEGANVFFDWLQQEFKCCGIDGQKDWKPKASSNATVAPVGNATVAPVASGVPKSCCIKDHTKPNCVKVSANLYTAGCKKKFEDFVKAKLVLIGAIALGIAFLQILGIIFACVMMIEIRGQYEVV